MNDEAQSPFSQAIVPGSPFPAVADSGSSAERFLDIRLDEPTFKEVFVVWEKLRLVYNGLLVAVVVAIFREAVFFVPLVFLVVPAILANVCFCAGPVAEGYLCLIQVPRWFALVCIWYGMLARYGCDLCFHQGKLDRLSDLAMKQCGRAPKLGRGRLRCRAAVMRR